MNHFPDLKNMPPAGVWHGPIPEGGKMLNHSVEANKMVAQEPPSVEMTPLDEHGLCLTVMVMEELKGLFPVQLELTKGFTGKYSSISLSWEAWVHALLECRI